MVIPYWRRALLFIAREGLFKMIKLVLFTTLLSITQLGLADTEKKPAVDMSAANQAHASIKSGDKKDQPFWSKDQVKQSELEKKYKAEIAKNPDDKKLYAYLAGLYLTNNKTSKAIDAYQDAITHDSENPKLFTALSIAYLHHSKYDMASAMASEALRLNPELSGAKKINEYVTAKKEAIELAAKIPAGGSKFDMSGVAPHGSVMPTAVGEKPADLLHKLN